MEPTLDAPAIEDLETFFAKATLPDRILLLPGSTIVDSPLFLKTQFSILRSSVDQTARRLAFERLLRLKTVMND